MCLSFPTPTVGIKRASAVQEISGTLYVILPDGVFLPCDHGLHFDIISLLCENSVNQSILAR